VIRIDTLVDRIRSKILDDAGVRVTKLDVVEAINEAKDLVVTDLMDCRENILGYLSTADTPLLLDIPASSPRIVMPGLVARVTQVEVLNGSEYVTIQEQRRGEWMSGMKTHSQVSVLYGDTTYEVIGPYIQLDRQVDSAVPAGLRVTCERYIADLLMGTATGGGAATVTLPSSVVAANGQSPASLEDDIYIGLDLEITAGTGSGQRRTISDYAGSTRIATVSAAWSTPPDSTSVFAMFTPFRNLVGAADKLVDLRARIALLTDGKINRDASGLASRYNELEEKLMSALDSRTPGMRAMIPLGVFD
jgi:hypothetical protein